MEGCYHVYIVEPTGGYSGCSLVAAESIEEAEKIVDEFRRKDPDNKMSSYGYSEVRELNLSDEVFSKNKGTTREDLRWKSDTTYTRSGQKSTATTDELWWQQKMLTKPIRLSKSSRKAIETTPWTVVGTRLLMRTTVSKIFSLVVRESLHTVLDMEVKYV